MKAGPSVPGPVPSDQLWQFPCPSGALTKFLLITQLWQILVDYTTLAYVADDLTLAKRHRLLEARKLMPVM